MIIVQGQPVGQNTYKGKDRTFYSHDVLVENALYGDRPSLIRIGVPPDSPYRKGELTLYKVHIGKDSRLDAYHVAFLDSDNAMVA